jgi:lauroyl/myristoyl acyltransferase
MKQLAARLVEALRRGTPTSLVPLVVWLRFRIAWLLPSVRDDARTQMRFLLEPARPGTDIDAAARAYVRRMIWRAEARWHPELLTQQRIVGFEHLLAARELGRGVILNYMHHAGYEGLSPSLSRLGVRSHMMGFDHIFGDDAPGWLKQNLRVSTSGGNTTVSVAVGSQGIADLLTQGHVVTLASDVPGRTPVRFAGRERLGSFGAARIAHSTGSPVVVATSEVDEHGQPFVRIHEALHPADFESPKELLEEMLARHEPVILAWPEGVDIPLLRWGQVTASTDPTGATPARAER